MMEIFFLWFVFAVVVGIGAGARGRNGFGWWLLAMLISPLLALILLVLLPSVTPGSTAAPHPDTHVKCPDCAELVLREARVCKHCGCKLVPYSEQPAQLAAQAEAGPPIDLFREVGAVLRDIGQIAAHLYRKAVKSLHR
jgi:hypothetical protein